MKTANTKQTETESDILTEDEVAKILGIEPRTVRAWRKRRGLPHYKVTSKVIRFSRSDIAGWLGSRRVSCVL